MERNRIWEAIELELRSAKRAHPNWPDHPAAQAGIVVEEAGELMKAALQWKYERADKSIDEQEQLYSMRDEAIQTAAMAIRFLENLKVI
jgi:hypothetical protein